MAEEEESWFAGLNEPGVVGLAQNVQGTAFQCGTCRWFGQGKCYNPHPRLYDFPVEREWCCNLYMHDGMKYIIA